MTEVVAEKLGLTPDAIASTLQRAIAKSNLPQRNGLVGGDGIAASAPWQNTKRYELAKKAGYAPNEFATEQYGGRTGDFDTFGKYIREIWGTKNGMQSAKLKAALSE